jgi:hypothetical protein
LILKLDKICSSESLVNYAGPYFLTSKIIMLFSQFLKNFKSIATLRSIKGKRIKDCKKVVGLERDAFSLVSTTEELLDRKVAAPV